MGVFRGALLGLVMWAMLIGGTLLVCEAQAGPLDGEWYAEIGAGYNTSFFNESVYQWENAGSPGFYGQLSYEFELAYGLSTGVYYVHASQWMAGPPFNDRAESSLDSVGVKVKFNLSKLWR